MSDRQVATQDTRREVRRESRRQIRPQSSLYEENGVITLRLEMPGVPKEGVDLEVEANELRIRGRRVAAAHETKRVLSERIDGDFYEVYTLDETVDRGKIDALMDNGVLTVTLHLREAEKPRKIQITAH